MKNTFLFVLFFFSAIHFSTAQKSDYQLVEQTLSYYLDGGTNNDFATLKKAFHETAVMRSVGKNYTEINALEFFGSKMKPGPRQDRKTRIGYINITGTAANAKVEIEYPAFTFTDYMNLLKIDGEWKIVSKIYYQKFHKKKEKSKLKMDKPQIKMKN